MTTKTQSSHKIGWLNLPGYKGETWNPVIGCSKVSEGCANCYAEKMAVRLANIPATEYYRLVTCRHAHAIPFEWNGKTHFVDSAINKPLHWRKPRVVFVCSMSDLFHKTVPFSQIDQVFETIGECSQHIFIILTKRTSRMHRYFKYRKMNGMSYGHSWVWIGTTAENQKAANERLPHLVQTPAAVRFVSVEPMLGPVNVSLWLYSGYMEPPFPDVINWVIVGGESGHKARPMHPDWVRSVRDQCKKAGTPFFFKQWGEYSPLSTTEGIQKLPFGEYNPSKKFGYLKLGKQKSGNLLDGVRFEEYPKSN